MQKSRIMMRMVEEWLLEWEWDLRTPVAGEGNAEERATMLLVKRHTWKLVSDEKDRGKLFWNLLWRSAWCFLGVGLFSRKHSLWQTGSDHSVLWLDRHCDIDNHRTTHHIFTRTIKSNEPCPFLHVGFFSKTKLCQIWVAYMFLTENV